MTQKTPDVKNSDVPSIRLALCQVETEPWEIEANVNRTVQALEEAGRQGAELAITPECVFHGYANSDESGFQEKMAALTESREGPHVRRIREVARRYEMEIVFGFAEQDEKGNFFNTALHVSAEGNIRYAYRKVHCRPFEAKTGQGLFTPGDAFYVDQVSFGNKGLFGLGTLICFDREIPESVRSLRSLGAQFLACPLATDTSRLDETPVGQINNEMITRTRAAENEVFIAVVNHAKRYNGGSFVVGPDGSVLIQLGPEPEVALLDCPIGVVAKQYHSDPLGWMGWGYRRPEIYGQYI